MSQLTFDDLAGMDPGGDAASERPLVIGQGAIGVEEHLLGQLARVRDEVRGQPDQLRVPLRIVVPSRSLRLHLCTRIAAQLGATAGILVQTVHGLAMEVLSNDGGAPRFGAGLFELLVQRAARRDEEFRRAFEGLDHGYAGVVGSVRDLFDAGFEPALAGPAIEALGEAGGTRARRARSLVRIATAVGQELEQAGADDATALFRAAAAAIGSDAARVLPTRELWIHGFADVTGRVGDLLVALARRVPTRAWVDHPTDPADRDEIDHGATFTRRWVERLESALGTALRSAPVAAPALEFFRAPGAEAEVREVAARIRSLLDARPAPAPESIGIVARDLHPYRAQLRTQLDRLGIPFSALRVRALLDGAGRRVLALIELLRRGSNCTADRWLDALHRFEVEDAEHRTQTPTFDLRLALRTIGAARLTDAAKIDTTRLLRKNDTFRLPARHGLQERSKDGQIATQTRRRHVRGFALRGLVAASQSLTARFARWPQDVPISSHLRAFETLRTRGLGWSPGDEAEARVRQALGTATRDWPEDTHMTFVEFVEWLVRELEEVAAPPLGGAGAGVSVLDAMEARGRTFEHLFVIGLRSDAFPRAVSEDPLLPDELRAKLAAVLPDIPIKARGHTEERYLFAQLLSASPRVTLSWQVADDEGQARLVSPLVERILGAERAAEVPVVAPLYPQQVEQVETSGDAPRPAHEHAVLAGLHGGPAAARRTLQLALEEAGAEDAQVLATVRGAVLREFDRHDAALGPWFGLLGPVESLGGRPDPVHEPLFVTRLEGMAHCPWQTFLLRVLQLEPPPDPLAALPAPDPRLIGNTVHEVLEAIVRRQAPVWPEDLDAALLTEGRSIPWPAHDEFERILARVAAARVEAEFHADLPGLVRVLIERARPHLVSATGLVGDAPTLGVELRGSARVALGHAEDSPEVELHFRADRVDRVDGTIVLTDFKTGKPIIQSKTRAEQHLLSKVAEGKNLQAAAYVEAVGDAPALGRYVFLKPDLAGWAQRAEVDGSNDELRTAFRHAVQTTLAAWRAGTFFPRFVEPRKNTTPDRCGYCEVAEACSRGDSGARLRLSRWAQANEVTGAGSAEMRALWFLGHEEETP